MKNTFRSGLATLAVATLTALSADAALIDITIGDPDFTDGDTVLTLAFNAAAAGEPAPFDMIRGGDPTANFSESWTFAYAPIVDPTEIILSASIEIGILDHDSAHAGSQLASFSADSTDLTSELDAQFEASGGGNNEYNVYSIPIPIAAFTDLRDGSATFSLALMGPTPGFSSSFPDLLFNGAGLDYARLQILTQDPPGPGPGPGPRVPEPSTLVIVLTGLGAVLARRR